MMRSFPDKASYQRVEECFGRPAHQVADVEDCQVSTPQVKGSPEGRDRTAELSM